MTILGWFLLLCAVVPGYFAVEALLLPFDEGAPFAFLLGLVCFAFVSAAGLALGWPGWEMAGCAR